MRLLHANTYQIHHFPGDEVPPYAILSHTWGQDEVTFKDVKKPHKLAPARRKRGWRKIELTCNQALQDGLQYAWVDTCCIDKSSSAELSEAINSMYKWYEGSQVCYVWLEDFVGGEVKKSFSEHMQDLGLATSDLGSYRQMAPDVEDEEYVMSSTIGSASWDAVEDGIGLPTSAGPSPMDGPALSSRVLSFEDIEFPSPSMVGDGQSRRNSAIRPNPPRPRDVPRSHTQSMVQQEQDRFYNKTAGRSELLAEALVELDEQRGYGDMKHCRWFTRGWTLQELLAPQHVIFFDHQWKCLGSKHELSSQISQYTRIPRAIIETRADISSVSVAQRMSWASYRQTTRVEDLAYCLLGIFGVNMALLYGEGKKAFLRLQEEVLRETDDQSIFAWVDKDTDPNAWHGLFATSPSMFAEGRQFVSFRDWAQPSLASMTSSGLSITLPLSREYGDVFTARLNCASSPYAATSPTTTMGSDSTSTNNVSTSDSEHFIVISLLRLPGQGNHYARIGAQWNLKVHSKSYVPTQVIIRQSPVKPRHGDINMARSLFIRGIVAEDDHLHSSICAWDDHSQTPTRITSRNPLSSSLIPIASGPQGVDVILALQPKFFFNDTSFPFFILLGPGSDPGVVACRYIDESAAATAFTCKEGYRVGCQECFVRLSSAFEALRQPTRYFHRDGKRDRTISVDSSFDEKSGAIAVSVEVSMGQYGKEWLVGMARNGRASVSGGNGSANASGIMVRNEGGRIGERANTSGW